MIDPILNWTISLSMALLWFAASWDKFHASQKFEETLAAYRILPKCCTRATAQLLPLLETVVAVGLLIPSSRSWAAQLGAAALLLYGLAMAVNLARGRRDLDCGCSPGRHQPISWLLLLRNLVFCALSLVLLLPVSSRPTDFGDILLTLVATGLACSSYVIAVSILQERDFNENVQD